MTGYFNHRLLRRVIGNNVLEALAFRALGLGRRRPALPRYRPSQRVPANKPTIPQNGPVFSTSRFRSGSTLLWQAIDALDGFSAYYEPLNERRWFDPVHRGASVDASHRGAVTYSKNYDDLERLGDLFNDRWNSDRLWLDARSQENDLKSYIIGLISNTRQRAFLQFNRVDFRLGFLREHFPDAAIVHLHRDARDIWRSTLKGMDNDASWVLRDFEPHSHFYLMPWYRDLCITFPEMRQDANKTHPYFVHTLIDRLSMLNALEHAHLFLKYEELCDTFVAQIEALMGAVGRRTEGLEAGMVLFPEEREKLQQLMSPRSQPYDHTSDASFYRDQECQVEEFLRAVLPT